MPVNPNAPLKGRNFVPILRSAIVEAQRHTNSNTSAAKWMGIGYKRYRKYAMLYGLWEGHLNEEGIGVDKGFSKRPTNTPLRDILAGKHPGYSLAKLKNRLLARKKIPNQCALCGFSEARITDGKVPLMMDFKDGDHHNFLLENLQLLCYNCMFLTTGAPSVVNRSAIPRSFTHPDSIPASHSFGPSRADYHDPDEEDELAGANIILSEEEKAELREEQDAES